MSGEKQRRTPWTEFEDGRIALEDYPVGVRIRIFASQMYAADGIGTWCVWEQDGEKRYFSTCVYEDAYYSFLELGNCLSFMEGREEGYDRPVVLSDTLGLTWLAEHAYGPTGEKDVLVIVGPMFMSSSSLKQIERTLADRIASVELRLNLMRTLTRIPIASFSSIMHYAKVLHLSLSNEFIAQSDIIVQNEEAVERRCREDEEPEENAKRPADDRLRRGEKMIMTAVREGNLRYPEIMEKELSFTDSLISHTGDTLRDGKISVTVFNAQCSRAAVEGGLSGRTAAEIESRYYSEIEACRSIMALKKVMDRLLKEYVTNVARNRASETSSRTIRECCDYIRANVTKPLTAEEIASEMGYAPYYLTKKFRRETGVKLGDYIKQTKVEYAKMLLLTTNRSVAEISDMLQFSNRNYFTKVFTDIAGVTPTAFRERTGR